MKKIFCDHCGREINDKEENIYDIEFSVEYKSPSKGWSFTDDSPYSKENCEDWYSYVKGKDVFAKILPPKV
jgi:hypothetical protein